ncbi:MAG: hypothetical protein BroJett006_05830 [Betaproteobacteria bacterium]|nr:MAG: hypothetical protein BroJett006_05830 [Betaproteobacteria bacterium]
MQLSPENQRWLEAFRARHGRAPRILHIGNIANNAYNNAKILNEVGLDCDVICYDYYHIMGCPEWEDADFTGQIKDDFRPDWTKVDLGGYVRPRWFAQGPLGLCTRYLIARRTGNDDHHRIWQELLVANQCESPKGIYRFIPRRLTVRWTARTIKQILLGPAPEVVRKITQFIGGRPIGNASLAISGLVLLLVFVVRVIAWPAVAGYRWRNRYKNETGFGINAKAAEERQAVLGIIDSYAREFKDRQDRLLPTDIQPYLCRRRQWRRLLACYDYAIGYSTDPILPLVAGMPYFAFEHGTIREIPYHATAQGRLTALAYRLAQHVFVTNFDCVESAEKLAPGRFTIINHPYDEDHGLKVIGWEQTRKSILSELDSDFLFFHPTRHDWVEGSGYADKSNDVFLRAFVSLRNEGARVGLVCCSWGANVAESKALLAEHGCSSHVRWIAPLAITPFERMCLAADLVVDQFKLGAFGGVVFKAMAVGKPILTYLDEKRLLKQYPVCPPVVNCRTEEEIISGLQPLLLSPNKLKHMGEASRAWMKKFHAKEGTVNAQVAQIRLFAPIPEASGVSQQLKSV